MPALSTMPDRSTAGGSTAAEASDAAQRALVADLRERLAVAAQKRVVEDLDGSVLASRMAELLVAR